MRCYGRLAEIARDYLRKGAKVYVEGRLQTDSWEDDKQQKHWRTYIVALDITLLDHRDNSRQPEPPQEVIEDNDIPF